MSGEREEWPAPEAYEWADVDGDTVSVRADYCNRTQSPVVQLTGTVYLTPSEACRLGTHLQRHAAHLGDEEARRVLRAAENDSQCWNEAHDEGHAKGREQERILIQGQLGMWIRAGLSAEQISRELGASNAGIGPANCLIDAGREQGRREERERWTPGRNTLDPGCTYRGAMAECHDVNCPVHGRNLRDTEPAKPAEDPEWRGVHDYVERKAREEQSEAARFKSTELRAAHADGVKQGREEEFKRWFALGNEALKREMPNVSHEKLWAYRVGVRGLMNAAQLDAEEDWCRRWEAGEIDNDCDDAEPAPTPEPEAAEDDYAAAEPRNDHHLTWDGQCLHWCPACKANIRAGLNPDGSGPEAAAEAGGGGDCDPWVKDAANRIGKETGDLLAALAKARDEARAEERRAWELALVLAREECESLQKPADEWAFALQCVRDFRDPRIQEMERRRTPAGDPDPHPENDDDCDDVVEPKDEPAPEYTAEDAAHDLTVATGIEHTTTGEAVLRDGWLRIDPGDPNGSKAGRFAVKDKGAVVQWFNSRRDAVRAVVRAECPEATEMWPTDEGLALGREVHNGVAYTELRCGLWVPERADERAEGNTADDAHVHVYMHGLCVHCGVRQPREEDDAELRAEIEALRATHTEDLAEHRSMIRRLAQQVWCLAERCTDQLNLTARPIIDQASRIEAQAARKERGGSGDG